MRPSSECACYSENVKRPALYATAGRDPTHLIFKLADGTRARLVSGTLRVAAEGRTPQDVAELVCAGLDEAAAEWGLADVRALLAANPSVSIAPTFTSSVAELEGLRSFNGRHCPAPGDQATPDLTTYYELRVPLADGERLMRALDANQLVTSAYFAPLPAPPPGG